MEDGDCVGPLVDSDCGDDPILTLDESQKKLHTPIEIYKQLESWGILNDVVT